MRTEKKLKLKQLRHWRIRKVVSGTSERPRMSDRFTNENIHVQFIDDVAGKTIAATSTVTKGKERALSANMEGAKKVGVTTVVFDKGSYKFHGRVKALAEAARAAGIKF